MQGEKHLRVQYGLSQQQYDWLLKAQGDVCAICGGPAKCPRWNKLKVDHNHSNGKVRGLLCGTCNSGLGMLQDNPELLRRAAEYLEAEGLHHELVAAGVPGPTPVGVRYTPETHQRKLNWDKVREIRALLADGVSQGELSRRFGVSQAMISRIELNKAWVVEDHNKVFHTTINSRRHTPRPELTHIDVDGDCRTLEEWAEETGLMVGTLRRRIKTGFTPKEAVMLKLNARRPIHGGRTLDV